MNELNYYRIKTTWMSEATDGGNLNKTKTEELVYATSYTEAEKVAYTLAETYSRNRFSDDITIEIIKTKMTTVLYNDILSTDEELICNLVNCGFAEGEDTGVGLYGVKVMFITTDERTAKEKRTHEVIYTPATSNADATARIAKHLSKDGAPSDFVIRDAKFDPAASILWPMETYKQKTLNA